MHIYIYSTNEHSLCIHNLLLVNNLFHRQINIVHIVLYTMNCSHVASTSYQAIVVYLCMSLS